MGGDFLGAYPTVLQCFAGLALDDLRAKRIKAAQQVDAKRRQAPADYVRAVGQLWAIDEMIRIRKVGGNNAE